ncbi:MAG: hypothetical protein B7X95_09580 [Methylophilaceae bacterium 17-44-8]|jgi:hypothetical protein|nr:MAG: hypothetical protein B7Y48_08860 [Methylophilales bacterium 28-44-11]OZA04604.1 MAG: hypothetical protein B7X95_09580 [Methylophilaceae bacterium 17-44-8]
MAVQFLPIIKAIAPYIAQIAAATIPAFSSKAEAAKTDPALANLIEELQTAATQNAHSIHVLAEKMQQTIQGIETAAVEAKKQVITYKVLLYISLGMSFTALLICIYLLGSM